METFSICLLHLNYFLLRFLLHPQNHHVSMITGLHDCAIFGNASTVNGYTVNSNVPSNAVFTDTIYVNPASHSINEISGLENMNKINITCIPWITFSNFKDAIDFNEKSSKPKICWGRYYLEEDKYLIDISLLVNHAFQDGYHMGLFFNKSQQNIDNLKIDKNLVKVR